MDEFQPLLQKSVEKLNIHPMALLHLVTIQFFSILNYFLDDSLGRFLVLRDWNAHYLTPFVLNVFTERCFVHYVANSVISVYLVNTLLTRLKIEQIAIFGCAVGAVSNFCVWFFMWVCSFASSSLTFRVSGSISTLIALAFLVVHMKLSRGTIQGTVVAYEFAALACVVVLTLISTSTLCAAVAAAISFVVLQKHADKFGIPKTEDAAEPEPWFADSLGLTESPELSEADRNRRMRVLRAIEERLEAFQAPPV